MRLSRKEERGSSRPGCGRARKPFYTHLAVPAAFIRPPTRGMGDHSTLRVVAVPDNAMEHHHVLAEAVARHKYSQLRRGCGYGRPGAVAAAQARAAAAIDLPMEEALSADERARLEQLHGALLAALQIDTVPNDWRRSFFMRARLLTYLRAEGGNVKKAAARTAICIAYCGDMWKRAYAWEAQPQAVKSLYDRLASWGAQGYDRRGCSVRYYRLGHLDLAGLVRETSFEIFMQWDSYCCLLEYDLYVQEGAARGIAYTLGKLVVADLAGLNLARALKTVRVASRQSKAFPGGEHPFPELTRCVFVTNMPWVADHLWQLSKRLMPARDVARVRIFGQNKTAQKRFINELEKYVDLSHVPSLFGGKSDEPWQYGTGGDVPVDAIFPKDVVSPQTPGKRMAAMGARISQSISHEWNEITHQVAEISLTMHEVSSHAVHTVQHVSRELSNISPRFSHRRKQSMNANDVAARYPSQGSARHSESREPMGRGSTLTSCQSPKEGGMRKEFHGIEEKCRV